MRRIFWTPRQKFPATPLSPPIWNAAFPYVPMLIFCHFGVFASCYAVEASDNGSGLTSRIGIRIPDIDCANKILFLVISSFLQRAAMLALQVLY